MHCKEARKEKLKALQVANTKKLRFEDFMETFLETATRIADGIDLDSFVEPASPGASPDDGWKTLPRYAEWYLYQTWATVVGRHILVSVWVSLIHTELLSLCGL